MILAGNQPYFLPYLGYWQLMDAADVFAIGDDYNYISKGWVNRNRILINGEPSWLNVIVEKASSFKKINELNLAPIPVDKELKKITLAYKKAPNFQDGIALMEEIYACPERNLAEFLIASMDTVRRYLKIDTQLVRTSDLENNSVFHREFRIYDLCRFYGANTYYNAVGGQKLYNYEEFQEHQIDLKFLQSGEIVYKQYNNEFVPNLSILDVIMFNERDKVIEMLKNYSIVTG